MDIPIISDLTRQISRDYGVMLEDEGHTLRGLFIIDDKGTVKLHAQLQSIISILAIRRLKFNHNFS